MNYLRGGEICHKSPEVTMDGKQNEFDFYKTILCPFRVLNVLDRRTGFSPSGATAAVALSE